ncbi:MAG TPA: hypothetical protein VMN36_15065 [Verrucomicrobiales bacterium]|nr:hypothetical protein [Verrucomicrobiales bacterium]
MESESNNTGGDRSGSKSSGGEGGSTLLRLPGNGFSIWLRELTGQKLPSTPDPSTLRSTLAPRTPVKAALKKEIAPAAPAKPLHLPGDGFTVWTKQEAALTEGVIRLPGSAFTVWTQPAAAAAGSLAPVEPVPIEASRVHEPAVEPVKSAKVVFHDDDDDYAPRKKGLMGRVLGKLSFLQWAALLLFLFLLWGFLSRGTQVEKWTGLAQRYEGEKNMLRTEKEQLTDDLISTRGEVSSKVREIENLTASFNSRREALEGEVRTLEGEVEKLQGEMVAQEEQWQEKMTVLTDAKTAVEKTLADQTASWEKSRGDYESEAESLKNRVVELGKAGEELSAKLAAAEQVVAGLGDENSALKKNTADLQESLASALSFGEEREGEWKKKLAAAAEESGVTRTLQTQLANAEIAYRKSAEDNESLRGRVAELEKALEEAATAGKAGDDRASGLEEQLQGIASVRDQLIDELRLKNDEITRLEQLEASREKEAVNSAEYETRLAEVQEALARARQDFSAREASLREQVAALNSLKVKFSGSLEEREKKIAELDAKIRETEKEYEEAGGSAEEGGSAADLNAELAALKRQLEALRERLRLADDDKQKWAQFVEELRLRAQQIEDGLKSGGVIVEQPQP